MTDYDQKNSPDSDSGQNLPRVPKPATLSRRNKSGIPISLCSFPNPHIRSHHEICSSPAYGHPVRPTSFLKYQRGNLSMFLQGFEVLWINETKIKSRFEAPTDHEHLKKLGSRHWTFYGDLPFQHLHHGRHRRPLLWHVIDAPEGHLQRPFHLLGVYNLSQGWIHKLHIQSRYRAWPAPTTGSTNRAYEGRRPRGCWRVGDSGGRSRSPATPSQSCRRRSWS